MATTTIQSGFSLASFGDSYMPSYSDAADIQKALKALYFGSTGAPVSTSGIYGALYTLYTGNPTLAGNLTVTGNLTVNGATTTINSTTLNVDDKLIELGAVASPTNTTADGGGISLLGATNKTILWDNTNANWTTSENFNIASGKTLKINNVTILDTNAPKSMATLMGYTSTATAAATTTLTNTSSYYQQFTGSTTQTVVLPVTSTLITGWTFHIVNNSTGNLTVNSSGGNAVIVVIPGTTAMVTCIGTALTTAADWESGLTDFGTYTGTGAVVLGTSPTITTPTITSIVNSGTLTVPTGGGTIATTAGVTNSIIQSLEPIFFGDGSDGDLTLTTTLSLTRDMFYNNLTISGATGVLATNGYRVFVAGTLDVTGAVANAISHNTSTGVAAPGSGSVTVVTGAAGATDTTPGPLGGTSGTSGGNGGSTSGSGGSNGTAYANTTSVFPNGFYTAPSGNNGSPATGTPPVGAGGVGGASTNPTLTFPARRAWVDWTPLAAGKLLSAAPGLGGGGGGGHASGGGGGGGGGGAGCYGLAIYANTINRSAGTAVGFINMVGGAGGAGGSVPAGTGGKGGGGTGGQGGFVYIVYGTLTGTSKAGAIKSTGGQGGSHGSGGNQGATGGHSGAVVLINLGAGTISYTAPVAGSSGGVPTGGAGGTASVTL